jgi:hypothetical protein
MSPRKIGSLNGYTKVNTELMLIFSAEMKFSEGPTLAKYGIHFTKLSSKPEIIGSTTNETSRRLNVLFVY